MPWNQNISSGFIFIFESRGWVLDVFLEVFYVVVGFFWGGDLPALYCILNAISFLIQQSIVLSAVPTENTVLFGLQVLL